MLEMHCPRSKIKSDIRSCRCKNFSIKQASGLMVGGWEPPDPPPWIRHCCKLLNPWEFQNILQTKLNRKTKPRTGHNVIQLCMKISHARNYGKPLSYSDPEALWRKVKSLKALFSRNKELYASRKRSQKMLFHQRANHLHDQKQKISKRVMTPQGETSG